MHSAAQWHKSVAEVYSGHDIGPMHSFARWLNSVSEVYNGHDIGVSGFHAEKAELGPERRAGTQGGGGGGGGGPKAGRGQGQSGRCISLVAMDISATQVTAPF